MNQIEIASKLMDAFKDVIQRPQPKEDNLIKTLTTLKELGVIGQQEKSEDVLERLRAMKDVLGLKYDHEANENDDPVKMVEEIKDIVEALRPFTPKPDRPSVASSLVGLLSVCAMPMLQTLSEVGKLIRTRTMCRVITAQRAQISQQGGNGDNRKLLSGGKGETVENEPPNMEDNKIHGPGADWCESMGIKAR